MIKDIMEVVQIMNSFANRAVKVDEREDVLEDIGSTNPELASELRHVIRWSNQHRFRWVKDYSADME